VIVALIVVFIGLFPAEGGVIPFDLTVALPALGPITFTNLGLTTLTGFATLNLLPLSVVNIALIYSRRRYPDIERGFRVPGVPLVPIIGVIANVALITNLPVKGVVVGVCLIVGMLAAYLIWGGKPDMDELYEEVVPSTTSASQVEAERAVAEADTTVADVAETDVTADASGGTAETPGEDSFRILVPVARPDRAVRYARLAAAMAEYQEGEPFVDVLTVTRSPNRRRTRRSRRSPAAGSRAFRSCWRPRTSTCRTRSKDTPVGTSGSTSSRRPGIRVEPRVDGLPRGAHRDR